MIARLFLALLLVATSALPAQENLATPVNSLDDARTRYEEAHMAFERGDTQEALRLYRQIAQSEYTSPSVWFNAGTAAYRSGDTGRAVLYFRRALRLDPGHDGARNSFEVISPETNRTEDGFTTLFLESLYARTSPAFWVLAAQLFLLGFWFALARTMAARTRDQRGHWFSILAWTLVFALVCGAIAWGNHGFRAGGNEAVVIQDRAITRSEPRPNATAELELPAGTLLHLTENPRNGFVRVKLLDGRTGYISTEHIERV